VNHFCTYFDANYLVRGLALYRSLEAHCDPFVLWVLCFDDASFAALVKLDRPDLRPVSLAQFEAGDADLLRAKLGRSRVEYYFTCTPSWPRYLMNAHPEIGMVTYVDADLLFFSDVEPLIAEIGTRSIGIIAHRFPPHLKKREVYGVYNVGLLTVRNDSTGRSCLEWWRERCLDWCFDRVENGCYADQKYLDEFPGRYGDAVVVIEHPGVGLAPWNWMNYEIELGDGGGAVDGRTLIAYHFHGLRLYGERFYDVRLARYRRMPRALRRDLYDGYVDALRAARAWAGEAIPAETMSGAPIRAGNGLLRLALAVVRGDLALYRSSSA
jgi:hypothetical protein